MNWYPEILSSEVTFPEGDEESDSLEHARTLPVTRLNVLPDSEHFARSDFRGEIEEGLALGQGPASHAAELLGSPTPSRQWIAHL